MENEMQQIHQVVKKSQVILWQNILKKQLMKTQNKDKKIYVALSGGVDSSVVAALLKEQGYDVTAVYMKNWSNNNGISDSCPWEKDVEDVEKVANHLGIPWKVYNFEREYKERILDYFFTEYKNGRTPNPDILCNNLIKFDLFAQRAFSEGASHMATGHYARRRSAQGFAWEQEGNLGLFTALDPAKDQVYFLQRLSEAQLERAVFPLGNLYKSEVRVLAKHFNLPNADKKDSQGICFIGDVDVRDFIKKNLQTNPGEIVDIETEKVIGRHQGLWFYTIGQRQGIGVASNAEPYFVVGKNASKNRLEIARGHNHPLLQKKSLQLSGLHTIASKINDGDELLASLRYREIPQPVRIAIKENGFAELSAISDKYFWAPAAGQGVLLYEGGKSMDFQHTRKISISTDNMATIQMIVQNFTTRENNIRNIQVKGSGMITD